MPFSKKIALGFILLTFVFLYFTKQNSVKPTTNSCL